MEFQESADTDVNMIKKGTCVRLISRQAKGQVSDEALN